MKRLKKHNLGTIENNFFCTALGSQYPHGWTLISLETSKQKLLLHKRSIQVSAMNLRALNLEY